MFAKKDVSPVQVDATASIKDWLVQWISQHLKIPTDQVNVTSSSFFYFGFDSVVIAEFLGDVEKRYGVVCDLNALYEMASLADLATYIAEQQNTAQSNADDDLKNTAKLIYFNVHEGISSNVTLVQGKEHINYSGYNYLGLSGHPAVTEAVIAAVREYGTSVSASRLASGEKPIHAQLEKAIANLIGTDDAIVFSAGYTTNVAAITHFYGTGDLILHDAYIHNSIVQGALYSGANRIMFPHNDYAALESLLQEHRAQFRQVLIVSEGVFSMDGDMPDIKKLIALKKQYHAHLMIDEAHSIGTLGEHGAGMREHAGIDASDVEIWMGTLSKAFASCGGYIAGKQALIDSIKYGSNEFIFSAGISPANTAAALSAIELMGKETHRLQTLHHRSQLLLTLLKEAQIPTGDSLGSPIIPVIVGDERLAMSLSQQLIDEAIYTLPIIYPAVKKGTARLRFFINCLHTEEQIHYTAQAIIRNYRTMVNPKVTS